MDEHVSEAGERGARSLQLRHLRYFIAVAEELHFKRAAERLNIAQPPLSQQIRHLEAELGILLLNRTRRRVDLTPAGAVFLAEARRILAHVSSAANVARQAAAGERGNIRVGVIYSAVYSLMPAVLRLLAQRHPNVLVDIAEMTISQQLAQLRGNEIDAGILRLPVCDETLSTRTLFEEGLLAIVPADHVLAARNVIELEDLAAFPFIVSGSGLQRNFRHEISSIYERRGIPLAISREVPGMHTLIGLVAAGLGVSLVPESVSAIQIANVVYLPVADDATRFAVALAWNKRVCNPALGKFIDAVCDGCAAPLSKRQCVHWNRSPALGLGAH